MNTVMILILILILIAIAVSLIAIIAEDNLDKQFYQLQLEAGLSNRQCAEWLKVTVRSIEKWRVEKPKAPEAAIIALKYRIKHGDL
jgi:type II secretory pathway component PulK